MRHFLWETKNQKILFGLQPSQLNQKGCIDCRQRSIKAVCQLICFGQILKWPWMLFYDYVVRLKIILQINMSSHLNIQRAARNLCVSKGSPTQKNPCIFGHCPNCNLTHPNAQIRALCGTNILPKMRKFFKQPFWLWEWIFWQWLRSKMILRWYSDANQGRYWWNWWKLSGSVMVYIHWRTATNNLGKRWIYSANNCGVLFSWGVSVCHSGTGLGKF